MHDSWGARGTLRMEDRCDDDDDDHEETVYAGYPFTACV